MIDPTIMIFAGGVICTGLAAFGGYIQGRNAARIESDKFWAMQKEVKAKSVQPRHEAGSKSAYKGHETRKRRKQVAIIVNITECNL